MLFSSKCGEANMVSTQNVLIRGLSPIFNLLYNEIFKKTLNSICNDIDTVKCTLRGFPETEHASQPLGQAMMTF